MKEVLSGIPKMMSDFVKKNVPRYGTIEINRECNRNCVYCDVASHYDRGTELTVDETCGEIDWLCNQGYGLISVIGGEPLAPYETKEGITFAEHTLRAVDYASGKGLVVNVSTNGDFVTRDVTVSLRNAGLDAISFSLHSPTDKGLEKLIMSAKLAAEAGIVPTVFSVFTVDNARQIPEIANEVAKNGVLFGVGIVQGKGGGFSKRQETNLIPTVEQQKEVFQTLLRLKRYGLVRNNQRYLSRMQSFQGKMWRCNPETDTFIHLGANGTVNVCSDVRTKLTTADIPLLRSDEAWRGIKRVRVRNCGGCLNQCFYETENPAPLGEITTFGVAMLIRSGNAKSAQRWGKYAVERSRKLII